MISSSGSVLPTQGNSISSNPRGDALSLMRILAALLTIPPSLCPFLRIDRRHGLELYGTAI